MNPVTPPAPTENTFAARLAVRHRIGQLFHVVCLGSTWVGLVVLLILLAGVIWKGWTYLGWDFLTHFDSVRKPKTAGIKAGLWGSFWLILYTALFSVPVGLGAAVYLEEYAKPTRLTRFIQLNIANLAGVPSIVYGILGLTLFVRLVGLGDRLLSGTLTLSLLILPVVIIASQEALRSVPASIRHGSYALGATQWQTIYYQVLPAALPGIMTGVILALSRAVGETAPLVMIGAATYLASVPGNLSSLGEVVSNPQSVLFVVPFDRFAAMPLVIYNWASQPGPVYEGLAAAGIVVLLLVLLVMNASAIFIRQRFQRRIRW